MTDENTLIKIVKKSLRDSKPWETLPSFFQVIEGAYMYEQAAREIADAQGWRDKQLEVLQADMLNAIHDGALPIRKHTTLMECPADWNEPLFLVTVDDVNEWLKGKRVPYRWKLQSTVINHHAAPVTDSEWVTQAQTRAREIVKESKARDLYPSQENLGDTIATEFRKSGIVGADGKPLKGSYIKRHALKGISSANGKQLSTTIGRGK